VVARPCEVSWEIVVLWLVCVAPLQLGGIRGKKSTPSVGWEVPVKSHRSASGSGWSMRDNDSGAVTLGYGTHAFILNGRLILILHFHLCTFNCVKKVFYLAFLIENLISS
jgi:hypothetical protein